MICTLKDLKELFGLAFEEGDALSAVESVSTDTRTIRPGSVFVAIKGEQFDGHDFVGKALSAGALAAVVRKGQLAPAGSLIEVEDTLEAYGRIAGLYRSRQGFKVVAITGSSGKTTTKDMVWSVLKKRFKVEKTYKNNNNEIGLPFTILGASPDTEILVLEMGMRSLGEIDYLARIARPDVGIITNIGIAHIGELGSRENILRAKGELFENLGDSALAIMSGEDGFAWQLSEKFQGEKRIFGFGPEATIRAENPEVKDGETRFDLVRDGKRVPVVLPYVGSHLILDSLIAIEAGLHFGIVLDEAVEALSNLEVTPGRLEVLRKGGCRIINDSYNANPESMKASLEVLMSYGGRTIAVLGDMKELGVEEDEYHREIGRIVAAGNVDYLITLGSLAEHIAGAAVAEGMAGSAVHAAASHEEAASLLEPLLTEDATVLVKGSRAMAMEKIIELLED